MEFSNHRLEIQSSNSEMDHEIYHIPTPNLLLKKSIPTKHNTRYIENFELEEYELVKEISEDNKIFQRETQFKSNSKKLNNNLESRRMSFNKIF